MTTSSPVNTSLNANNNEDQTDNSNSGFTNETNDRESSVNIQDVSRNSIITTTGDINFGGQFDVNDNGDWNSTAMLPTNFWEMADKGIWEMTESLFTQPFPNADSEIAQPTSAASTVNLVSSTTGLRDFLPTPPVEMTATRDALSALSRADLYVVQLTKSLAFLSRILNLDTPALQCYSRMYQD